MQGNLLGLKQGNKLTYLCPEVMEALETSDKINRDRCKLWMLGRSNDHQLKELIIGLLKDYQSSQQ